MKKLKFVSLMIAALFMGFSFTSCEEDESILATEDEDVELNIAEGDQSAVTTIYVSDLDAGATSAEVTVNFTSVDSKMRRLYMTQNIAGAGYEKYELDLDGLDTKGDGSIDLSSGEGYDFTFTIPFPVLSGITEGTVEYQLWATSGRGDYRDVENDLVAGPGKVIINYGGTNPAAIAVKEYSAKLLAAPTADSNSETFISLIDGKVYPIKDGEEYVSYWDFGYYWLQNEAIGASLASPNDYREDIVDIATLANTDEELNKTYFKKSDLTVAEFDNIINSSELDYIEQSLDETINVLTEGSVVEFIDNYGNKGLIKVNEIVPGYTGSIEIDIKVQR